MAEIPDSGFFVGDRGLPWHVASARALGTAEKMAEVDGLLTSAEALTTAGLDWDVLTQPIVIAGTDIQIPGKWATQRSDTLAPLGVVGRAYRVVQNRDAFSFADAIVDSGEAKWETAGCMRGGTWTFISMELDHLGLQVPGDPSEMKTYLLVLNSHDGSRPVEAHITRVRVVCTNTAELARAGAQSSFRIRHSGTVDGKIAEARKALGVAFRNTEMVKELTGRLAATSLLDKQVAEIFEKSVWPLDEDLSEAAQERHHSRLAFELYQSSPNLEGIRGNAWGAFNAVTEYVDHVVEYKGRSASGEDVRADALLFGRGKSTKDRALTALLAVAK